MENTCSICLVLTCIFYLLIGLHHNSTHLYTGHCIHNHTVLLVQPVHYHRWVDQTLKKHQYIYVQSSTKNMQLDLQMLTLTCNSIQLIESHNAWSIIESLRLKKTSKIIKSNCHPTTTRTAEPCPEVPYLHIFWTPPGMVTQSPPWAAHSNAWPLFQ